MSDPSAAHEIAVQFAELNEHLVAGGSQESALQRLVDLAVGSVPGCTWAAVTVWPTGQRPRTLASSHDVAREVDRLQYDLGDGPCLVAAARPTPIVVADLARDDRWPRFRDVALARTPLRCVLSFHLVDEPQRAGLNLYGARPVAFDTDATGVAALFATHARVLLGHADSAGRATRLARALETSRQIGTAIGILMHSHRIDADAAFDLLRRSSQHLHRKLRDVADEVTETGTLPDPGPRPGARDT